MKEFFKTWICWTVLFLTLQDYQYAFKIPNSFFYVLCIECSLSLSHPFSCLFFYVTISREKPCIQESLPWLILALCHMSALILSPVWNSQNHHSMFACPFSLLDCKRWEASGWMSHTASLALEQSWNKAMYHSMWLEWEWWTFFPFPEWKVQEGVAIAAK